MSNTFTGLLRTLKSTSSARESMLLSSCELELTELMHQIDIMVENKRLEWEQQLKTLQIQCERKERDIQKLRETIEHRNKEVGQLQQKIEFDADKHKKMITKYEDQLGKLKYELDNVKKNYGKLQRNSNKQSEDAEKFRDQLTAEKEKHDEEMQKQALLIEDLEAKVRDLETTNDVQEAKLKGMEEKRKSFLEKSEVMQNQLLSYQGQLTRKKQLLDNLEQKHVMQIAELENEILRYKDELEAKSETIKSLKISLEEKKVNEDKYWNDQLELKDESSILRRNMQKKDQKISSLEKEILSLEKTREKHERSMSLQENSLLQKSKKQEQMLAEYRNECNRLRKELADKSSQDEFNDTSNSVSKDIIKLKGQLEQRKTEHAVEVEGMRKQVTSLIEELHRRDSALANMSEHAAKMEENTRELSSKHDKKEAELQVANAQLEALRLENRHLRDTSVEDHLSSTADLRMFESHIADVETSNARTIAQLEDENNLLKHEIQAIRDERVELASGNLSGREMETQISLPSAEYSDDKTNEKIASLQERLDETVKHYEDKLKELRAQNQSLSKDADSQETDVSNEANSPNRVGNSPSNLPKLEDDFSGDGNDLANFFDVLRDDSLASSNGSRRQSVTRDFMIEEDKREKELQTILEARIKDLEHKTQAAMQKYGL